MVERQRFRSDRLRSVLSIVELASRNGKLLGIELSGRLDSDEDVPCYVLISADWAFLSMFNHLPIKNDCGAIVATALFTVADDPLPFSFECLMESATHLSEKYTGKWLNPVGNSNAVLSCPLQLVRGSESTRV